MPEKSRIKWNERYLRESDGWSEPSAFLEEIAHLLPSSGRAIDVEGWFDGIHEGRLVASKR